MKKYKPEKIVTLLRQVEVELASGKTTPQTCKGKRELVVEQFNTISAPTIWGQ